MYNLLFLLIRLIADLQGLRRCVLGIRYFMSYYDRQNTRVNHLLRKMLDGGILSISINLSTHMSIANAYASKVFRLRYEMFIASYKRRLPCDVSLVSTSPVSLHLY